MSPLTAQGDYISDLDPVLTPIKELPGGLFELDLLTGPVAGAYVSKKLTVEQLLEYLAAMATGGPAQIRTYWPVIFLTKAEAIAAGRPNCATLDQLDPTLLCTGSVARVDLYPGAPGTELILVYDTRADQSTAGGIRAYIDGNFQLYKDLTPDGLNPLKWVKKNSLEAVLAGIRRYDAAYAKWGKDETMKIDFAGTDAFFSAVAAGGPFAAPTAPGVATTDWKPAAEPAVGSAVLTELQLNSQPGSRTAVIKLTSALTLVTIVALAANNVQAYALQVNTYASNWQAGATRTTLAAAQADIDALTASQYAAGVELEITITAVDTTAEAILILSFRA
jgi:hypothetical protein